MLCRHGGAARPLSRFRTGMGNQLGKETVRASEADDALVVEARLRMLEFDALSDEALDPEADSAGNDRERRYRCLSSSLPAAPRFGPGEERENSSRRSLIVPEVEMVGGGVVEVDGALDEPH